MTPIPKRPDEMLIGKVAGAKNTLETGYRNNPAGMMALDQDTIAHEHAVAVRAVEALRNIAINSDDACYPAQEALDEIEASGWTP